MNFYPDEPRRIVLSEKELCVCAAFLKIPVLQGMKSEFYADFKVNPVKDIQKTVYNLEKNNFLFCGLDGKVYMHPVIYRCLKIMETPQWMIWMRRMKGRRNLTEQLVYGIEDISVQVVKEQFGLCQLKLLNKGEKKESFINDIDFVGMPQNFIEEKISIEILIRAAEQLESFCEQNAEKQLKECMNNPTVENVELVKSIISNKVVLQSWNYYQWNDTRMERIEKQYWGIWKNRRFRLELQEDFLKISGGNE